MKNSILIGVLVAVMPVAPAALAEEPMCTRDWLITIYDISVLIDYMQIGKAQVAAPYWVDFNADCMIDSEDLDLGVACAHPPDFCNHLTPFTTCCDPLVLWTTDTARARGDAAVTCEGGTATVTGVGSSGEDGVRIWPNMEENWKNAVNVGLDGIDLSGDLAEATFAFAGVDQSYDMEWVARADASHGEGVVEITLGLGELVEPTLYLRAAVAGVEVMASTFDGTELLLSGDPTGGWPTVTALSLEYISTTTLTLELDRTVEFTVVGESPAVEFAADELVLRSENSLVPVQGLGPFDVTAANISSFAVSFDQCCYGRVGDANCRDGDEPTIGDVSYLIWSKFESIGPIELCCRDEADVNQSGGANPGFSDVTIGDISVLIDYLFITGPSLGLNECID